jgi:hypothetical protein
MVTRVNILCDKRFGTKFDHDPNKLRIKLEKDENPKKNYHINLIENSFQYFPTADK